MEQFIQVIKLFDASTLAVYQKISNWFQKVFGLTNFLLARACLTCLGTFNLICFVIGIVILKDFTIISIILMVIVGILIFFGFRICTRSEREYYIKTKNNFLNKNEKIFLVWRIFSVTFFTFRAVVFAQVLATGFNTELMIIYGILLCHHVIIVHFFYFVSCTPLPPGESKAKAALKALKEKVSGFLSPQPDVMPT